MKRPRQCYQLLLLSSLGTVGIKVSEATLPFGIQSDDGDIASSYATGMFYDPEIERIYITGSTYGAFFDPSSPYETKISDHDCFIATIQPPYENDERGPLWLRRKSVGDYDALESCSSVFVRNKEGFRDYYTVGHSLGHSSTAEQIAQADGVDDKVSAFGTLFELNYAGQLKSGYLLQSSIMQFPVNIVGAENGKDLFIALVQSDEDYKGSSYDRWLESQFTLLPDPDIFGSFLPPWHGTVYTATIMRLHYSKAEAENSPAAGEGNGDADNNVDFDWSEGWSTTIDMAENRSMYVTGLLHLGQDDLIVSGFQRKLSQAEEEIQYEGFVSNVEAESGTIVRLTNMASVLEKNHMILGACASDGSSTSDLFVVGITENKLAPGGSASDFMGSYQAFIIKMDSSTFDILWLTEIGGVSNTEPSDGVQVQGLACKATPDKNIVYVAGTAKNGASLSFDGISNITSSSGKDDIFLAQIQVTDGSINFVKQLGTKEDDSLARGQGLLTDSEGNAILLVNTKGSLFRTKSKLAEGITSDIAIFSIDRESGRGVFTKSDGVSFTENEHLEESKEKLNNIHGEEITIPMDENLLSSAVPSIANSPFARTAMNSSSTDSANKLLKDSMTLFPDTLLSSDTQDVNEPESTQSEKKYNPVIPLAVAILTCLISASLTMLCILHFRRKKEEALKNTLYSAEGSYYSGSVLHRIKSIYVNGSICKDNVTGSTDNIYLSDEHEMDEHSLASGTTIRPLQKNKGDYGDALLCLAPTVKNLRDETFERAMSILEDGWDSNRLNMKNELKSQNRDTDGQRECVDQFDISEVCQSRMRTLSDLYTSTSASSIVDKERACKAEELLHNLMQ